MSLRFSVLLALTLVAAGCANQTATNSSGSRLDTGTAVERSPFIFVGKILTSQQSNVPSNTFFSDVRSDVKVVRSIRGKVGDVVEVGYSLDPQGVESPFRIGDTCIYCIFVRSLAEPGVYLVGKILPATPENIAAVEREAANDQ